jgi:hypothetical protein
MQGLALENFVQGTLLNKTEQERDNLSRRNRDARENQSLQQQQEVDSLVESNQVLECHSQECAKKMDEQQERIAFLKSRQLAVLEHNAEGRHRS